MSTQKIDVPIIINKRIAMVRKEKHLTQKEFALYLKVSQGYLSEVENGKGKPSIEMLTGIHNCFNDINPDWLLSGKGRMYREEKLETEKQPKWLTNWWQQSDDEHKYWLKIQLNQTPPNTNNQ